MSVKTIAARKDMDFATGSVFFDSKIMVGAVIFIAAFVLLAYVLGNAEIVMPPLAPNRIL